MCDLTSQGLSWRSSEQRYVDGKPTASFHHSTSACCQDNIPAPNLLKRARERRRLTEVGKSSPVPKCQEQPSSASIPASSRTATGEAGLTGFCQDGAKCNRTSEASGRMRGPLAAETHLRKRRAQTGACSFSSGTRCRFTLEARAMVQAGLRATMHRLTDTSLPLKIRGDHRPRRLQG